MKKQNSTSIFIVDDDKIFTKALKQDIENTFVKKEVMISCFHTGEACLERVKKEKPDMVILDYHLDSVDIKAMNGLATLIEIKKLSPDTEVVMLTKQDNLTIAVSLLKNGAVDYIIKSETTFNKINNAILNAMRLINLKNEARNARMISVLTLFSVAFIFGVIMILRFVKPGIFD